MNLRNRLLIAIVALVVGAGVSVAITSDENGKRTVTINVGTKKIDPPGPVGPVEVDTDNTISPADVDLTQGVEGDKNKPVLHEDLRDETPPGVTPVEDDRVDDKSEKIADDLEPKPVGGAQSYNCVPQNVVNQSALSGRRVGVALHFTVSSPGSLDSIQSLFNRPSFGASSNYGFELYNGRCERWVPENRKAWTQGAFNSAYVSIEIVTNNLTRAQWLATPAFKNGTLAALVRDISTRIGSPKKLVDPSGCTPVAGIVDHDRLECGNSHWDVGPGFPWDVFIKQVNQGVKAPITDRDRSSCRKVNAFRARSESARIKGATARQEARLRFVAGHDLKCVKGKPVRK